MNFTSLITSDSNKGVGKKGSKTSTTRRKGGQNTNKAPPTNVVDRVTCVSTLQTVSLSPLTSTNPTYLQPQLVATDLQHSNSAFVNSSFQCNQPSGATYPSMVYAGRSSSQSSGGSSHAYGGFRITFPQLCSPLVRLCYGCSQILMPGGIIATPPNDLVIMTRMNRQYRDNTTGEMRSKEGNVYFHLNVHCIRRKQPYFSPQIATLSDESPPYLTQAHLHFLTAFGLNLPF